MHKDWSTLQQDTCGTYQKLRNLLALLYSIKNVQRTVHYLQCYLLIANCTEVFTVICSCSRAIRVSTQLVQYEYVLVNVQ